MREGAFCERVFGASAVASVLLLMLISFFATTADASPWVMAGARYQAMGGAGVAIANDSLANYWNPANLAFEKGYDVQLPVTLDADIENHALEELGDLLFQADQVSAALDQAQTGTGQLSQPDALGVTNVLLRFARLGRDGQSVQFGVNLGLNGHSGALGVQALSFSTGTVHPDVDVTNLSLFSSAPDGQTAINSFVGAGTPTPPNDIALRNEIVNLNAGWTQAQANSFVLMAEQGGFDTNDPGTRLLIHTVAAQTGTQSNSLANNGTGALVAGLSTQEFGISYGHKLPIPFFEALSNRIAIGGTAKYMLGISFVKFVRFDSGNSAGGLVTDGLNFSNRKISHNFGLDLGVTARPFDWLRLGMTARNVNSPSFDANQVGEITLDPQVRMGVGLYPAKGLVLALDVDATKNKIVTLPGFSSRLLSMGAEYTLPLGGAVALALRFGAYENTESAVNQDWALTGGLGLRLWRFVLDVSGAGSLEKERVRTSSNQFIDLPTRFNAGLTLKWEKSI